MTMRMMNLGGGEIIFEPHNMSWVDAVSKKNWEKVKIKLETENAHS